MYYMGIQKEIYDAIKQFSFEKLSIEIDNEKVINLVKLTSENVILAEAIYQIMYGHYDLNIDDKQKADINKIETNVPEGDGLGEKQVGELREQLNRIKDQNNNVTPDPSSYWFREIHKYEKKDKHFLFLLIGACHAVNRENSTHLNNKELCEMVKWIYHNKTPQELIMFLKNKDLNIIANLRKIKEIRDNYSFITKFCHYACFYMFDDEARDNYSIYDKVLSDYIPYYYYHYVILKGRRDKIPNNEIIKMRNEFQNNGNKDNDGNKKCKNDYKDYVSKIDKIIKGSDVKISHNGFDHLLWIYHR